MSFEMNADRIARAIRTEDTTRNDNAHTVIGARAALNSVPLRLARELEKDQPHFDRNAFLQACGISSTRRQSETRNVSQLRIKISEFIADSGLEVSIKKGQRTRRLSH